MSCEFSYLVSFIHTQTNYCLLAPRRPHKPFPHTHLLQSMQGELSKHVSDHANFLCRLSHIFGKAFKPLHNWLFALSQPNKQSLFSPGKCYQKTRTTTQNQNQSQNQKINKYINNRVVAAKKDSKAAFTPASDEVCLLPWPDSTLHFPSTPLQRPNSKI